MSIFGILRFGHNTTNSNDQLNVDTFISELLLFLSPELELFREHNESDSVDFEMAAVQLTQVYARLVGAIQVMQLSLLLTVSRDTTYTLH